MAGGHDELVRTYAEHIRELRLRLGLTQAEFARRLRVHPQTVSEWERGVAVPQRRARRRLSRMLSTIPDPPIDPESEAA